MPWTRALIAFFAAALSISSLSSRAQTLPPNPYVIPFKVVRAAFDPIQPRAFVVPAGTNRIEVVNHNNRTIVAGIDLPQSPESIAITPDGRRMFVALVERNTQRTSGWVADIDLSSLTIVKTNAVDLVPADIVATDFGVFVVSGALPGTGVATFSAATGAQIDSVFGMPTALQLALHPMQDRVYGADPVYMRTSINHLPIARDGTIGVPWSGPGTGHHVGEDVFIVPTGTEILTRGGTFLTSSTNQAEDLKYTRSVAAEVHSLSGDTNFNITAYVANGDDLQVTDYGMTQGLRHFPVIGAEYVKIYDGRIIVLAVGEEDSRFHFFRLNAPNPEFNRPPIVTLNTNVYPEIFPVGRTLTIQARAWDEDGSVQLIKAFQGTNELASRVGIDWLDTLATIDVGTNEFYAVAYDNLNAAATSLVTRIVGNYVPEVRITQPATSIVTSYSFPEEVVLRAEATDPDGTITNVRLVVNGTVLASDTETPYEFVFTPAGYGTYFVEVQAIDNVGLQSSASRTFRYLRPADNFPSDIPFVAGTNVTIIASTFDATRQKFEPLHAGEPGGRSIWWRWAPPEGLNAISGTVIIDTHGSDFDTLLAVYTVPPQTSPTLTNLVLVASNDDYPNEAPTSRVKFSANRGQFFFIAVDGRDGVAGRAKLTIKFQPSLTSTVANDDLLRAVRIVESTQLPGSNIGATKELGEPDHAGNPGGASVWWRFEAQSGGTLIISTRGSTFDTVLAIYTNATPQIQVPGPSVTNLRLVASNDDGPNTTTSFVAFSPMLPFATYWVAVDGYNGAQGDINISLSRLQLPSFPPTNDLFINASALVGRSVLTNGSNMRASGEPGEPPHIEGRWTGSVWYKWVAPTNGPALISTKGSEFDTVLAIYTGTNITSLSRVAMNDDDPSGLQTSAVIFDATAETQYFIAVAGYSFGTGNLILTVNQTPGFGPRLLSQWDDGRLVLRAAAVTGTVTIESSSDLMNWKFVRTLPGGEGEFAIIPGELQAQQFYRLRFSE